MYVYLFCLLYFHLYIYYTSRLVYLFYYLILIPLTDFLPTLYSLSHPRAGGGGRGGHIMLAAAGGHRQVGGAAGGTGGGGSDCGISRADGGGR